MPANLISIKRLWPALAGLLFCLFLAGPAWAADFVWTGGGAGDSWDDPDNWDDPPNIPGAGDTIRFNGTSRVTLGADREVDAVNLSEYTVSFDGGGTYSLTAATVTLLRSGGRVRMSNAGDHLYITSAFNLGDNRLYLSGPGGFTVQGANSINMTSSGFIYLGDARLNLNGDQTIYFPASQFGAGSEINLSNSATLTLAPYGGSGVSADFSGVISGNGNLTVIRSPSGHYLFLRGANTYNGSTTIASGSLSTHLDNCLPVGTDLTIAAGAYIYINRDQTIYSLSGPGYLLLNFSHLLRIDGGGTHTFSGDLLNDGLPNGVFEKDGAGTAILTGRVEANTRVTNGSLMVTNGPIAGSLTINGGYFTPGNGIGTIDVDDGFTMQSGGSLNIQVSGATEDRLIVTGSVDLNGGTLNVSGTPTVGSSFTIIDNDGAGDSVGGTFAGLPEAATFTAGGYTYEITYVGGDGNDVVLTVLSAPATPQPDPEPEPEPEPDTDPKPGTPAGTSPNPTTSLNGPSLSWPRVSGASSYRVFRAACPTCAKEEIGRVRDTSFVDQSALPGQVYYYFVRGEGSGGFSDYSDWMAAWRYEQNPGRAGDFNGDGIADLLWWEPDTNELKIWLMNGGEVQTVTNPGAGQDISQWLLINTGDFNNDGVCDIMWWNPQAGAVEIWYMSRTQGAASGADGDGFQATSSPGSVLGNSTLSYTGDVNGDGRADILWRNYETGEVTLWIMGADGQPQLNGPPTLAAGVADSGRPGVTGSLEWGVRGLFDMDGDGKADVIWQHASDGGVVVWGMDGAQAIGFAVFQQDGNWRLAGMGDLDGDGKTDFVWSNQESGEIRTWLMHSYYTDEKVIVGGSAEATSWQVKAVGEFCSRGCDDVYCKHSETGAVLILKLDGQSFAPSVE